jgi:hypothetical protein
VRVQESIVRLSESALSAQASAKRGVSAIHVRIAAGRPPDKAEPLLRHTVLVGLREDKTGPRGPAGSADEVVMPSARQKARRFR